MIEDNRGDVLLVREALKHNGIPFDLVHVSDGQTALALLESREGHERPPRPDLILLDLNIPKHDGWEVLQRIRQNPDLVSTPVVILSSSGNPEDLAKASRSPGSLYIRKPSTLDEFLAIGAQIEAFRLAVRNSQKRPV
jgi:CheY-like chemotaxis protein